MAASVKEYITLASGHVITVRPGNGTVVKIVPPTYNEWQKEKHLLPIFFNWWT